MNQQLTTAVATSFTHHPALNDGEKYAGILLGKDGQPDQHIILLPGETKAEWQKAIDWAKEQGGELPTRPEQALLYANLPEEFEKTYYWSDTQHASISRWAWCQNFAYGNQYSSSKSDELAPAPSADYPFNPLLIF